MNTIVPPIDPERAAAWLARLSSILGDLRDALTAAPGDAALEQRWLEARALRTLVRRVRYGLVDAAELHDRLPACTTPCSPVDASAGASEGPAADALAAAAGALADWACEARAHLPATTPVRREFYVYVHRAPDGAVFYVGKGRARRAWSRARTDVWRRYVAERLDGRYEVELLRERLTQAEALQLEAAEIERHGPALVNWRNPSRDFDAAALERARLLRADTLARVGSAQFLEQHAPAEALRRYRLALADVLVYARMPVERGLLAELKDVDRCGDPIVLDRLTRLLERLGRRWEARAAAQRYFAEFPAAVATAAGQRVRRRCERLALLD